MKKKIKKSNLTRLIVGIIVFLAVALVLGVVLRFSNCATDSFKTFYVESENHKIYSTTDTAYIDADSETRFNVKYLFEKSKKTSADYSVKIVPVINDDTVFEYTVKNQKYLFNSTLDVSAAFELNQQDGYFTITAPSSMLEILRMSYEQYYIVVPDDVNMFAISYFRLIISSYDDKNTIILNLQLDEDIGGVYPDCDVIIFE